jgi:hypothetical protein
MTTRIPCPAHDFAMMEEGNRDVENKNDGKLVSGAKQERALDAGRGWVFILRE